MDANDRLVPMVEDDQGEGVMNPIPQELAAQIQQLEEKESQVSTAEEMIAALDGEEESTEPIPWLPKLGTKFTLEFDQGPREYKVMYINGGKFRFSCEPVDKSYLK